MMMIMMMDLLARCYHDVKLNFPEQEANATEFLLLNMGLLISVRHWPRGSAFGLLLATVLV